MDRRKLRRLLASSSFAALLVAAEQVRGQDLTNPAGSVGSFLQVTAGDVILGDVINFGTLIGGGTPEVGIEVEGGGTVNGRVSNDGLIDIDNTNQATGIRMDGTGGFVGEGIHNHGLIDIEVSGTGKGLVARGIAVEGANNVVLSAIDNDDGGTINLILRANHTVVGSKAKAAASGQATGIFVGSDVTLSGGVTNAALIEVLVSNRADATGIVSKGATASAVVKGTGYGVHSTANLLTDGFINRNTGLVDVNVANRASAFASATVSGLADATAQANGKAVGIDLQAVTITGGVNNDGALDVDIFQSAFASALVSGTKAGKALAGVEAKGKATGIRVEASVLSADLDGFAFQNDGEVFFVDATMLARASASANNSGLATATAKAVAKGTAWGIQLEVDRINGDFENEGLVDVRAFVRATADADAFSDTDKAIANGILQDSKAWARGVGVEGTVLTGDFVNAGIGAVMIVDATLSARADAFAKSLGTGKAAFADATVSNAVARATGITFEMDSLFGDARNDGTITVNAKAVIAPEATATAPKGNAEAAALATNVEAGAVGANYEGTTISGSVTNDADITARAWIGGVTSLGAITTGVSAAAVGDKALAQVEVNNFTASATGLQVEFDTIDGDLVNNGDVSARATANFKAVADASADILLAKAGFKASDIEADATGIEFNGDEFIGGNIANSGAVGAHALVVFDARAEADAGKSVALALAGVEDVEASAIGLLIDYNNDDIFGSVSNSGDVTATAKLDGADSLGAFADAAQLANAKAIWNDAEAIAIAMQLNADTVGGGVVNEGNLLAAASVLLRVQASALAGGEGATAFAKVLEVDASATGFNLEVDTVTGDSVNSGNIQAQALAQLVVEAFASSTKAGADATAILDQDDQVNVEAYGLDHHVDTVFGNVTNSGDITVSGAIHAGIQQVGTAPGLSYGFYASAKAKTTVTAVASWLEASISVTGFHAPFDTITGNLVNEGNVVALGSLTALVQAKATSLSGTANATADFEDLEIEVLGVAFSGTSLGGNMRNSGDVRATGVAVIEVKATAIATKVIGNAEASVDEVDILAIGLGMAAATVSGSVGNSGDVTARALLNAGDSVRAVATGEAANANADWDEVNLTAVAYAMFFETVQGDIVNDGALRAIAQASIAAFADANAGASAGEADAKVDDIDLLARGLDVEIDDSLVGNLVNNGSAYAAAVLTVEATASALSTNSGADADATVEDVELAATAMRVIADNDDILGSVTNNGNLTAIGQINVLVSTVKANANGTNATVEAHWEDVSIDINGLFLDVDSLGGSFSNSGSVQVWATAHIVALATAVAKNDASATASAETITLDARGLNLEVETVGGSVVNEGSVSVQALLLGGDSVKAVATAADADAKAEWDEVSLTAIAYEMDFDTVLGNITNDGNLSAVARASLAAFADANAVADAGEAAAKVDDVSLLARGLDLEINDTLFGNLVNNGSAYAAAILTVEVTASALSTGEDGGAEATAEDIDLTATAMRVIADNDDILGSVTNNGNLTAIGRINVQVSTVKANASGTNATAEAHWEDVSIDVNGLFLEAETLGGSFNNSGSVQVWATAHIEALATAKATANANATASAETITLDARGLNIEVETVGGDVVNQGSVSVQALLQGGDTLKAVATGEAAEADANWDDVSLTAIAYEMDFDTVLGNITNDGNLSAVARAHLAAFADANAAASGGEADAKIDDVSLVARGLDVEIDDTLFGSLVNNGNAYAAAILTVEVTASAVSTGADADADAVVEDVEISATAVRIIADNDHILGSVTNNGNLTALALLNVTASSVRARATGPQATVSAKWEDIDLDATGLRLEAETLGGSFSNAGAIRAVASAHLVIDAAFASGATSGVAIAKAIDADVEAAGISIEANTIFGAVTNSAQILVRADLSISAEATAEGGAGAFNAKATIENPKATAIGIGVSATSLGGGFSNSGYVQVIAEVDAVGRATAFDNLGLGTVTATVEGAKARATGLLVEGFNSLSGGFNNNGQLYVQADVFALADVSGSIPSKATADAKAWAWGMHADGGTLNGGMSNAGTITVRATAVARAETFFNLTENATADAKAIGVHLDLTWMTGDARNEGLIDVKAFASAIGTSTANAKATAVGIRAEIANFATGSLINAGTILVNATANAPALAVGMEIVGNAFWSGALSNATDGFLDIFADDPAAATAIGLRIDGTAFVQGGIVNAGTVLAEAVADPGKAKARAIDLSQATGTGHTIQMLDGLLRAITRTSALATAEIGTAVYMADNAKSDTFVWSGGLVEANIIGDKTQDTMNAIQGKDDSHNFNHLIDGLLALNVNTAGQAATPVELRIGGTARNIEDLNVNENGTLVVGREAKISADQYNQDVDGTVVFEIGPGNNNNGVITANVVANLDGAIGIRPVAGLYNNTQTHLVIDGPLNPADNGFDTAFSNSPLLSLALADVEDATSDVVLTVRRNAFDSLPGLTENQNELGGAIEDFYDPVALAGTELGDEVIAELFTLSTDDYLDALDDLHGAEHAQMAYAAYEAMDFVLGGVNQRLHDGRSVSSGGGQSASLGNQSLQYAAITSGDEGVTNTQVAAVGNNPDQPGSVWGRGYGSFGSLDGDDEAPGYDRTTGAIVVGVDYQIDEQFLVGLVGAYAFSSIDFDDGDDGDIDSWQIGLFGSWDSGTWYVDGLLSYAFQSYETTRHIDFIDEKAEGDYDGGAFQAYGELGYQFQVGQQGLITPLLGLGYTSVWTDSFTETGAGGANLRVDEASFDSLATTLGVRGSLALDGWEPSLFLGWRHEFLDDHGEADIAFAAQPGSQWTVIGSEVGSDAGLVGVGVVAEISEQFEATIDYGGQFSGSGSSHTGSIGLRLKF